MQLSARDRQRSLRACVLLLFAGAVLAPRGVAACPNHDLTRIAGDIVLVYLPRVERDLKQLQRSLEKQKARKRSLEKQKARKVALADTRELDENIADTKELIEDAKEELRLHAENALWLLKQCPPSRDSLAHFNKLVDVEVSESNPTIHLKNLSTPGLRRVTVHKVKGDPTEYDCGNGFKELAACRRFQDQPEAREQLPVGTYRVLASDGRVEMPVDESWVFPGDHKTVDLEHVMTRVQVSLPPRTSAGHAKPASGSQPATSRAGDCTEHIGAGLLFRGRELSSRELAEGFLALPGPYELTHGKTGRVVKRGNVPRLTDKKEHTISLIPVSVRTSDGGVPSNPIHFNGHPLDEEEPLCGFLAAPGDYTAVAASSDGREPLVRIGSIGQGSPRGVAAAQTVVIDGTPVHSIHMDDTNSLPPWLHLTVSGISMAVSTGFFLWYLDAKSNASDKIEEFNKHHAPDPHFLMDPTRLAYHEARLAIRRRELIEKAGWVSLIATIPAVGYSILELLRSPSKLVVEEKKSAARAPASEAMVGPVGNLRDSIGLSLVGRF